VAAAARAARWAALAVASVLVLGWLALYVAILPHIDRWRGSLEAEASARLGARVTIGSVAASGGGWLPALALADVVLHDDDGRVALALPRVHAVVSPKSLLVLEVRFAQVLLEAPALDVRRDRAGRIRVAGIDLGSGLPGDGRDSDAADWFFRQSEFAIRGGAVRWTDERRDSAATLALENVDLVVRNGFAQHAVRLDATPPAAWGDRFTVRGRFRQPVFAAPGDWRRWSGELHAELPRADVRELSQHVTLPFELSEGVGALRGWMDLDRGEPVGATADVALAAVSLRLGREVEPMRFASVAGRIVATRDPLAGGAPASGAQRTTRIAVQDLGFTTGDGVVWPGGDLTLAWRDGGDGVPVGGTLAAERLDIGVMSDIAERMPLGTAIRRLLGELAPQGVVSRLEARWEGPIEQPQRYGVKATARGLALAAGAADAPGTPGRPGFAGGAVELDATESGGRATLAIADGHVDLPGVFADARLPFTRLGAALQWTVAPSARPGAEPDIVVTVRDATFANADVRGSVAGTWRSGAGEGVGHGGRYPGVLDLKGRVVDGEAARTARYLPLGLPAELRGYVARAVRGGRITGAEFRVLGDLWDFPYRRPEGGGEPAGTFRIAATVANATFAFLPEDDGVARGAGRPAWPALTGVAGRLVVDGDGIAFDDVQARLGAVEFRQIAGRVVDGARGAVLTMGGRTTSPLADMLTVVRSTPVDGWTEGALGSAAGTGSAELKLGFVVPLGDPAAATVDGTLVLPGNDVRFTPGGPLLAAAKARIEFDQRSFRVSQGAARVFGQDIVFAGGRPAGATSTPRFTAEGLIGPQALRRAADWNGAIARFGAATGGEARWSGSLAFADGDTVFEATSDLAGLALDLPAPLGKTAASTLPLSLEMRFAANGSETLRAALGRETLRAHFVRDAPPPGPPREGPTGPPRGDGSAPRRPATASSPSDGAAAPLRGALRIDDGSSHRAPTRAALAEALVLPATGVVATVAAARIDVDAWQAAFDRLVDGPTPASVSSPARLALPPASAPAAATTVGTAEAELARPDRVVLHVGELQSGSRRLTGVRATLVDDGGQWRARVVADQLEGSIDYRPPRRTASGTTTAGRVIARLARLSLPRGDAERQVETLLDQEPSHLPALDIVVDRFELRGRDLGRLEIQAANRAGGGRGERDWQLSKLALSLPEAEFSATGRWSASGAAPGAAAPSRRTELAFTLAVANSGALLERLGFDGVIQGGKGSIAGDLAWTGSPLALDSSRIAGDLKVKIGQGRFLKADPGAARLLGVLSLQSLTRRFSLDFRDFGAGFAFDEVTGDVRVAGGKATTNNLKMRGATAAVLMEGSADLVAETQDLRVVVVPEINAGTASLAYAIINPAVGLGTFLAQLLFKEPLTAAGTREFRVTGDWDDARVERVARSAPPAASAPPEPRRE
jgi:uncharacterized protein YhdP